jgi:hypothetical protein
MRAAEDKVMNKRIARELRNRLAPLSAVAVTFATFSAVPAATMIATAGGTGAHQAEAGWMDRAAQVRRDQHLRIGLRDDGYFLSNGYRVSALHIAARAPGSAIR